MPGRWHHCLGAPLIQAGGRTGSLVGELKSSRHMERGTMLNSCEMLLRVDMTAPTKRIRIPPQKRTAETTEPQ